MRSHAWLQREIVRVLKQAGRPLSYEEIAKLVSHGKRGKPRLDYALKVLIQKAGVRNDGVERILTIVYGRLHEYYQPFQISNEDVLRIRALRDHNAARRLRSIESPNLPPHPQMLEIKRRILATPWHPAHEGADYVHSANECAAPEKHDPSRRRP
jgi:hypothetical protein